MWLFLLSANEIFLCWTIKKCGLNQIQINSISAAGSSIKWKGRKNVHLSIFPLDSACLVCGNKAHVSTELLLCLSR